MKKMKKVFALLLAVIMTASLVACGGKTTEDPAPEKEIEVQEGVENQEGLVVDETATYKKDIVIAYEQKHTSMDPQAVSNGIQDTLFNMTHNQLVTFNYSTKALEPELATSWESKEGGKVWTFKLRDDVEFHNGEKLTADDVIYTFERAKATGVVTVTTTDLLESVVAEDDYTVTYTLTSPNMDFLYYIAQAYNAILNREACEADAETGFEIGTGGWVLTDWMANEHASYARYDNSWVWADGLTPTETVTFKIMTEASTRAISVTTGEVDVAFRPNLNELAGYADNDAVDFFVMASDSIDYLAFNYGNEVLKDQNLRKAISYAIDVQGILDVATEGYGGMTTTLWGESQFGFFDDFSDPLGYDLEKAKEYMAKSNYPNGCDLEITTVSSYSMFAEVLQAQLSAIGVNVKVNITDTPGLNEMAANNTLEAFVFNKGCGPDGDNFRNILVKGQGANRANYDNKRVAELLDLALAEPDEATRLSYYEEVQQIIHDESYYIPLGYPVTHALYNKGISGVIWNPSQKHDYTYVVCAE